MYICIYSFMCISICIYIYNTSVGSSLSAGNILYVYGMDVNGYQGGQCQLGSCMRAHGKIPAQGIICNK